MTKVDRMSMATSLEARVPLLDHKLIDFVMQIPTELKLKGLGNEIYFQKSRATELCRMKFSTVEKQGFGVPIDEWINSQLARSEFTKL